MRAILSLALKDLRLISRDWLGVFFIVAFPVLMGVFFGLIFGSMGDEEGTSKLQIAVVDEDDSAISQQFVRSLSEQGKVEVQQLPREEAADGVRRGKLVGFIGIPEGFGESAGILWADPPPTLQLGMDPSRKAEAGMLQGYVMQAMGDLVGQRFRDPTAMRNMVAEAREKMVADPDIPAPARQLLGTMMSSLDGFLDSLDEVMEQEAADGSTETESRMSGLQLANFESVDVTRPQKTDESGGSENLEDKLQSAWDITFPQATMWGILACAAGFAITMVRERTRGTMVRLQVAPITHTQIIAGKSLACMIGVLSVITFMLVLGYALGMRPRNFPLLIAAMLCIASCFVGMMMLMSVLGRTEEAVGGAAWGANVVMAMFGGGMIPLAFMPPFMLTLSHFSPVKWSVLALEGAIWRGFSLREILPSFLILLAIGVTGFIIGAWLLRRRAAAA